MPLMKLIFLTLLLLFHATLSSSTTSNILNQGSSLSVENGETDVLVSPNGDFSAGFFPVGENAFSFAIWFTKSSVPTVVWMANRDQPVNGRRSKLSLTKDGNLVLLDVGRVQFWSTQTTPSSAVKLQLYDSGNLVLRSAAASGEDDVVYWQSFESPTDTLLPNQNLKMDTRLVASVSCTNYSSGYFHFFFDDKNTLRLRFQGHDRAGVYWPAPWLGPFEIGRFRYNISKSAMINSIGEFSSSDNMFFSALDHGAKINRRLTLDTDGNLRLYSFDEKTKSWTVTWQAISSPCNVHGICGPNSMCSYDHVSGRSCSCVPGYKMKNSSDWAFGCEPLFEWRHNEESSFYRIKNAEFYGYDKNFYENLSLKECEQQCLNFSDCKGIQYHISNNFNPGSRCYSKHMLVNGARTSSFVGDVHIRLPKDKFSYFVKLHEQMKTEQLLCSSKMVMLDRAYYKVKENVGLKVLLWVAVALAGVEMVCVLVVLSFLYWSRKESKLDSHGYTLAALTRFQKFTYSELRKATAGFCNKIGAGGGGTVYKGVLADGRVAAIKRLTESTGGEAEFLAEVSTIGRLNHMNLIEIWGYCAEGKHRLLVYEFMEHGSLADNLKNTELDWEKRFDIAMGTSKGLAYLHEECLEWVLHCDVKPENILLDSDYNPKVADFGLSKLLNRGECHDQSFSRIRGTRGYMAPEWVYNLPITSKVDVYSYGMVVIELVTGREMADQHGRLVTWVKEKMNGDGGMESRIEELIDPMLELGEFDKEKIKVLVKVALLCVEEDKDARPSMRQVVEMLQYHDN